MAHLDRWLTDMVQKKGSDLHLAAETAQNYGNERPVHARAHDVGEDGARGATTNPPSRTAATEKSG